MPAASFKSVSAVFGLRRRSASAVEVRPRVGHHLDLADVELRPRGVMLSGLFAAEVVAYQGRGETSVGDEAVLHGMAHVHKLFSGVHDPKPSVAASDDSHPRIELFN
jgi:hypothetical protein